MTEEERAIGEIQAHINSGKLLAFGLNVRMVPPIRFADFQWRGVRINQPVALVRLLDEAEAFANLPDRRGMAPFPWYYEAVID